MSCSDNPKSKRGWRKLFGRPAGHRFSLFKVEKTMTSYSYHLHYKCDYCGIRRLNSFVDENQEILQWLEAQTLVDKLKGNE